MTITADDLRKLLEAATPGPWVWREDEWGSHNLVHWVEGETFANGEPMFHCIHSDGSANGEYSPDIDVDGPDAALIALAPYLASRVIAAEKLVDALRECLDFLESECAGWPTAEPERRVARAALAEYEAKK